MNSPLLGITMGDPAGVGPEIIAKSFKLHGKTFPQCVIFGSPEIIINEFKKVKFSTPIHVINSLDKIKPMPLDKGILLYQATEIPKKIPIGRVDGQCGSAAYDAIVTAINAANLGYVKALVTAPINKESLREAAVSFIGHTEILAGLTDSPQVFMLMVNDALKVILCTVHVSLKKAIESLKEKLVYQAIKTAETACFRLDVKKPRIGVAGLNPHAGENNLMGEEDSLIIKPAVDQAFREGIDVTGPWPPDTVFMKAREGHFDIVVAQYHDQGLIPIKYLGLDTGVNITMGLPFVRTSPDHGTAFDIAGKGIANPNSFISAVSFASKLGA